MKEAGHRKRGSQGWKHSSLFLILLLAFWHGLALGAAAATAEEPVRVIVTGVEEEILQNVQSAVSIPPGVVTDGAVNAEWFARFERQIPEMVRRALEPFGFYSAQVKVEISTEDNKHYVVRIAVEAGSPVIVNAVEVSLQGPGAKERYLRELAAAFPLHEGHVLRHDRYEKAKAGLKNRALEGGYPDAEFSVSRILVSRSEGTAAIELILDTGRQYFFGEATLEGAEIYPDSFLRRYLAFKPGDVYSPTGLSMTQLNLMSSDRFKDVIILPERDKSEDLRIPVNIKLEPSLPKRLRFGVGYGTDTGARFTISYKDLNVSRRGHELGTELNVSQFKQGLITGYRIPGDNVDSFTGLSMKLQREDVTTYVSQQVSLEVNRTRGFGPGRIGTAFVRLLRETSTVGGEEADARLVLPGLRFSDQHYDNFIRPSKGYHLAVQGMGTGRFLGSDMALLQTQADGKIIIPLPGRLSLIGRSQAAATFVRDPLSEVPASLRFFAGGDNSVRGYAYQSLGPKDEAGDVVGGRHLLVGSLEIERAILQKWGVAGFYDIGNAFNILTDITLAQSAGIGVRYYTPVGAVRFDIARQIGIDEPGFRFHFSLGLQL